MPRSRFESGGISGEVRLIRWVERLLTRALKIAARKANLDPSRQSVQVTMSTYSPWLEDADFQQVYENVAGHSLVDAKRLHELWSLVEETANIPGHILEVGSWRGGSGCLLGHRAAVLAPGKQVYLCDTFSGVVKADARRDNAYLGNEHSDTSEAIVRDLAIRLGLTNVDIRAGIFPDETGGPLEAERFSICHVDVDVYQSAKEIFDWVWPRLSPGGVVVFDDYGFSDTAGVRSFVNELRAGDSRIVLYNLNGHAVVVKTGAPDSGSSGLFGREPVSVEAEACT